MTPTQRLAIAVVIAIGFAAGFAAGRVLLRPKVDVAQPIAFNHQTHAGDLELSCDTCHQYYTEGEHSGLPTLALCLDCHEEPATDSAEEQKIRDLAAAGELDVFRKLFVLPEHSFYSHRRHAVVGEVPCETCHGNIANTTAPPRQPLVRITMDFCIDCHEREQIRSECTSCHR